MKTAIYFANGRMQIVCGTARGDRVRLRSFRTLEAPEGALINGVVTDEHALGKGLFQLFRDEKLGKKVRIAVDSSEISFKAMEVPFLKPAQLQDTVRREFEQSDQRYEDQITDYAVLEERREGQENGRILCCAMDRGMLEGYQSLFRDLKRKLLTVDLGLNCIIKAVDLIPELRGQKYVLSYIERQMMTCILFDDGQYLFSNRSRLASEPGTDEYAAEVAGKLSAMNQFYKAQKGDVTIERAYFCEMDQETIDRCQAMASILGIQVSALPESPLVTVDGRSGGEPFALKNYLPAVGCLLRK